MTGEGLICRISNLQPIEGCDNIQQAHFFGETVIVDNSTKENDLGILFDCETKLSTEYLTVNNLYRKPEFNLDKEKTGYFELTGRVRPIKLRGIKVTAFFMPIESLKSFVRNLDNLVEGTYITEVNKKPICSKYIRPIKNIGGKNRLRGTNKKNLVPSFVEHIDTGHLLKELKNLQVGDHAIITTKMHGTSCRAGYMPVEKNSWIDRLLFSIGLQKKPKYAFCVGSRRVIKHIDGENISKHESYYDNDIWTKSATARFKGKLAPNEEVYYEIVGSLPDGSPIMPICDNRKLKKFLDKDEYKAFIDEYGLDTKYKYGTRPQEYAVYVYRITRNGVDLTWNQVKRRCEEMSVNHVPEIAEFFVDDEHKTTAWWEDNYESPRCLHFPDEIREGVVLRLERGTLIPHFLKYKNFVFKVLEDIVKDTANNIEEEN